MKVNQMLYQMFILGLDEKNTLKALKQGLSGIIFFTKDIKSSEGFRTLVVDLKNNSLIPPFLSIDQEGGKVERTLNIFGGSKYLSPQFAFEKGFDFLEMQTQQIAAELKDFGLNLNFAPCVDVNSNLDNPIIGERAFSSNPDEVIEAAKIVSSIYRQNGIIPCIKHFPGHGDTIADSHLELPVVSLSQTEMQEIHLKPFRELILDGIEMVMVAHLDAKCFANDGIPTSLNKKAIDYLKNKLNFKGIIISDDMFMKALSKYGFLDACEMGIRAGINLFIYREASDEILEMIEQLAVKAETDKVLFEKIEYSYSKIKNLKEKFLK